MSDITQALQAIDRGEGRAAEQLLPLVYEELRRLAAHKMAGERPGQTLQPTALVHEAWLKIAGDGNEQFANRRHFFKAAEVVQLRYFVSMTVPEIAAALDLSPRTVDRHWGFARAWLKRTIRTSLSGPAGPGSDSVA